MKLRQSATFASFCRSDGPLNVCACVFWSEARIYEAQLPSSGALHRCVNNQAKHRIKALHTLTADKEQVSPCVGNSKSFLKSFS